MQINHCLILAAGYGTRMGSIGQQLPKVLWPVFEKTLLELQVAYARSLGIEYIYINLHFMGDTIEEFCNTKASFDGVKFLWETPDILDIGGAIHNLAGLKEVNYKGKLLVLNADQFFYFKKDDLFRFLAPYKKSPAVLFTHWVNSSLGYNALELSSNRLITGIKKNKDIPRNQTIETYTGIAYIDLAQLSKSSGPSSFFESVCPFQEKEITAIHLNNIEYWDFGTLKRYWETSFKILETYRTHSNHPFLRFLVNEKALKTWKIDLLKLSYHAKFPKVINLNSDKESEELSNSIVISGKAAFKKPYPTIWWNDLVDEVK